MGCLQSHIFVQRKVSNLCNVGRLDDPRKDTSGPALSIVMKLTLILSFVFGSAIAAHSKCRWRPFLVELGLLLRSSADTVVPCRFEVHARVCSRIFLSSAR